MPRASTSGSRSFRAAAAPGYTGGAIPLTRLSAVINTEKLEAMSPIEDVVLPGPRARGAGRALRRGRRHQARDGSRRRRGTRLRVRSDLVRRLVHRRQRRDERRRQESGAVGHRARQPRVVEDGDARRAVDARRAPRAQPRQDPRRRRREVPDHALRRPTATRPSASPRSSRSRAASSARRASART